MFVDRGVNMCSESFSDIKMTHLISPGGQGVMVFVPFADLVNPQADIVRWANVSFAGAFLIP